MSAKKSTAKKAPVRKSTAKKASATKSTAKKAPVRKSTGKKAPAKKASATKSTAKKAPVRKSAATKKAPTKKSTSGKALATVRATRSSLTGSSAGLATVRKPRGDTLRTISAVRKEKISVTVPGPLIEEVRDRAPSGEVSAYITEAVARQVERDRLLDLIEEFEAEHGEISDEDVEKALDLWPAE